MNYEELFHEVVNYAMGANQVLFSFDDFIQNTKEIFINPNFSRARKLFRLEGDTILPAKLYRQKPELFDRMSTEFFAEPGFSIWNNPVSKIDLDDPETYMSTNDFDTEEFDEIKTRRPIINCMRRISQKFHLVHAA